MKLAIRLLSFSTGISIALPLLFYLLSSWEMKGLEGKGLYVAILGLGFLVQTVMVLILSVLVLIGDSSKLKLLKIILIILVYLPLIYMLFFNNSAYVLLCIISLIIWIIYIVLEYKKLTKE
jgi:hypothetical protein